MRKNIRVFGVIFLAVIVAFIAYRMSHPVSTQTRTTSVPSSNKIGAPLESQPEEIKSDRVVSNPTQETVLKEKLLAGTISPVVFPKRSQIDVAQLDSSLILDRRVTDLGNGTILRLFLVNGGGSYPYHRIEELLRWDAAKNNYFIERQSLTVADHFLVKLRQGVGEKELNELNRRFGTHTLESMAFANKYIIQTPSPTLDGVATFSELFAKENEWVERVNVNPIHAPSVIPNDTNWSSLWGKQVMDCPAAWDTQTGSTNIIVAVIDTGVDFDHPDLAANIWHNPGEAGDLATNGIDDDANGYVDDWIGWDFGHNDNNPDDNGDEDYDGVFSAGSHGTHCAGIIGAVGNNATQVAGVCWNVRVMALKPFEYLTAYGKMLVYGSKAELAMEYAANNGAKLTSNSYGGPGSGADYYDGINYLNSSGVLFVASAGNDTEDNDAVAYQPSGVDLPNVIAVASSASGEQLSYFSNYGSNTVDVVAPGSLILSTTPNGLTSTKSGTSMAGPQVAGALALLYSQNPDIDPLDLKQVLFDGVEQFPAYTNRCVTHGRINVKNSMDLLDGLFIHAPVTGDLWFQLSTQTVQWATSSTGILLRISLYQGGSNIMTIASNVDVAATSYDWPVPDTFPAADDYQIKIEDMANPSLFRQGGFFSIRPWSPYTESFETGAGIWSQDAGDDFDWDRNSGSTLSSLTGPSGAYDGTYYLYTEASIPNSPSKTASLVSKDFPFSLLDNPEISFAYHMYGSTMGSLFLEVSTNAGTAWNTEWSCSGDQGDQWFKTNLNLAAYSGTSVRLRFRAVTGAGYLSDMAIDDIAISNAISLLMAEVTDIDVPEGSTNTFGVKFSGVLNSVVTVNVSRISGDTSIAVQSGSQLIFNQSNWSNWQTVVLSAAEDADWTNGTATIRCSADGKTPIDITAAEIDNDFNPSLILPFSETFETGGDDAGTLGDLDGQHGWIASGSGATVQSTVAHGGSQSLRLQNASASHLFDNTASVTNVQLNFWVIPVAGEVPVTTQNDLAALFFLNTNLHIVAYSNTTPVELSATVDTNSWTKFTVDLDYGSQTWSLRLNGVSIASDFPFYAAQTELSELAIADGSSGAFSYIDDINVDQPGDIPDSDGDGIPDSWELLYYGGATNANPSGLAANGINTIAEAYIAGLDPTNALSLFTPANAVLQGTNLVFGWASASGRVYTIYWASNLFSAFTPMQSNYTGGVFTDTVHDAYNDGFYRIEVKLAP